jgi:hypothetical protein
MTTLDNSLREEDFKLIIFGWITTVLGIPEKADPTKYNELTDRLYDLFTKELSTRVAEAQTGLIDKTIATVKRNPDSALDILWKMKSELTNKNKGGKDGQS